MRRSALLSISCLLLVAPAATPGDVVLRVSDPDGAATRVAAPVSVEVDLGELFGEDAPARRWRLSEVKSAGPQDASDPPVPAQFEPKAPGSRRGTLWWMMPPGGQGERRFRLSPVRGASASVWQASHDKAGEAMDLVDRALPALRYNHGTVPVPEGTHAHFAQGESYARGDYIHPLFGPNGEELTEDYPKDHPHHRGVWWSWPVTRWKGQIGDIWAVVRVWSRPVAMRRVEAGPVFALLEAENVWKFGREEKPIVREEVLIRAFRQTNRCRFVDVEVRLTALADDVAIGGRPKRGYGGFALRAAPCEERKISLFTDPEGASPRRAWIDYSGVFAGGDGMAGVAIFEHVSNPDYPNPLHQYPQCNCVMPAYPAARQVVLSKEQPLVLKHRLWIHPGGADEKKLAEVWASYAKPPKVGVGG